MTGGQEKNFSTLGPKLRENRAQQHYGDKTLQIRVESSDYWKANDQTIILSSENVQKVHCRPKLWEFEKKFP